MLKNSFILLLLVLIISCNQQKVTTFTIKGSLTGVSEDTIQITICDKNYSVAVNKDGNFEFSKDIEEPEYYTISFENEFPLYVSPGDIQNFELSEDTIIISGNGKTINQYLQIQKKHFNTVMSGFEDEKIFSLSEDNFIQAVDSFMTELSKPLQQTIGEGIIANRLFIESEKNRIKYHRYDLLATYHRYSPSFTQKTTLPGSDYFKFIDSADFNNHKLLKLNEYKEFIVSYVLELSFIESIYKPSSPLNKTKSMIEIAENKFPEQHIKDFVIAKIIERQLNSFEVNDSTILVYKHKYANIQTISDVLLKYEKIKPLLIGNKAPDFVIKNTKGERVSLSNFLGKTVYIDVWSPFCAPCLHEIPNYIKLQNEFKNSKIAFLSICLDNSEKRWNEYVEKYNLKGILLRPENGWNSEFVSEYQIQSVPCCILIDKNGNLISARAPLPGSSVLRELLKKNL